MKIDDFNSIDYEQFEGAILVASDGKAIGKITGNEFDSDSIINEFGRFGSEFSHESIMNQFGPYGSEFSNLSPFNEFTSNPPRIVKAGKSLAYVTVNEFLSPRVDPRMLIAC
jgi:hypothetical protein